MHKFTREFIQNDDNLLVFYFKFNIKNWHVLKGKAKQLTISQHFCFGDFSLSFEFATKFFAMFLVAS